MRFQVDWNQIAFTITDQALSEGDQEDVDAATSVFQILAQAGDLVADGEPQGERDRGFRGLDPLGLFLRTSIPSIWRVLSACLPA